MLAKKILLVTLGLAVIALGWWYYHNSFARRVVSGVISNPATNLQSTAGRTNLVLLGIGGADHEGGDLTDSIILVSLELTNRQVTLISIPRDIWVDSLRAKVNTAYHYGEERRAGGGRDLVKSAVSEITGLPIHYAVVLDFSGFVQAIDAVGGLDLVVDRTFDDYKYPIPGRETALPESDRYEHIHFDAGPTHMDGATALKFARSRHAIGDEGTDFARSKRQEKIILAFREKIFSSSTLFNATTLTNLKSTVASSIDTDVSESESGSFLKVLLGMNRTDDIHSVGLEQLFINPKNSRVYDDQWVLVPSESWDNIHAYVAENLVK